MTLQRIVYRCLIGSCREPPIHCREEGLTLGSPWLGCCPALCCACCGAQAPCSARPANCQQLSTANSWVAWGMPYRSEHIAPNARPDSPCPPLCAESPWLSRPPPWLPKPPPSLHWPQPWLLKRPPSLHWPPPSLRWRPLCSEPPWLLRPSPWLLR